MPENVTFSRQLQRQMHIGFRFHHYRLVALLLTLGEAVALFIYFKHLDYLGAYTMASYLSKEHLLSRME